MTRVTKGFLRTSGVLVITVVVGAMTPVAAQTPKAEVSGGYQYTHVPDLNFPVGWFGDVAVNINDLFGIAGEVTGARRTETEQVTRTQSVDVNLQLLTFMAGVRIASHANAKVVPFVQVLAGGARLSAGANVPTNGINVGTAESHLALQEGGGVFLMMMPKVGVRVGGDLRTVFFEGGHENEFRMTAGVVFALGR